MKYLKTSEGFSNIYKKEDYVLLFDVLYDNGVVPDILCKVIEYEPKNNENYPYEVEFYNGRKIRIGYYEIKRYLTPEEIEQYNIRQEQIKYNL